MELRALWDFAPYGTSRRSALLRDLTVHVLASLHLLLPTENGAPVLVLGHGHAAFDADTHALYGRWGVRREETLEKRHSGSPGYSDKTWSLRNEPRPGYTSQSDRSRRKHWLDQRIRQRVGRASAD